MILFSHLVSKPAVIMMLRTTVHDIDPQAAPMRLADGLLLWH